MDELINTVENFILIVTGLIFAIYIILGLSLDKAHKKKYGKTSILSWIPILNIVLLGKLAIHSIVGLILLILPLAYLLTLIPINGNILIQINSDYSMMLLYSIIGFYILCFILMISKKKRLNFEKNEVVEEIKPNVSEVPVTENSETKIQMPKPDLLASNNVSSDQNSVENPILETSISEENKSIVEPKEDNSNFESSSNRFVDIFQNDNVFANTTPETPLPSNTPPTANTLMKEQNNSFSQNLNENNLTSIFEQMNVIPLENQNSDEIPLQDINIVEESNSEQKNV